MKIHSKASGKEKDTYFEATEGSDEDGFTGARQKWMTQQRVTSEDVYEDEYEAGFIDFGDTPRDRGDSSTEEEWSLHARPRRRYSPFFRFKVLPAFLRRRLL